MDQGLKQSWQGNNKAVKEVSLFTLIAAVILVPVIYLKLTVESHIVLKEMIICIAGIILFFGTIINSASGERDKIKYCVLDVLVMVFALFSLATIFFSINKSEGILTWVVYPPLVIIYLYISRNAEQIASRVIPAISVSATLIAIITITVSVLSWVRLGEGAPGAMVRLKDILVFPLGGNNFTAAFLTFAIPATACLKEGTGIRSFRNKALVIQAAGIAACFGRIAIVITVVFALLWFLSMVVGKSVRRDWRGPCAIILGMMIAASSFFLLVSNEPRQAVVNDLMIAPDGGAEQGLDSMHMRLFWWKDSVRMVAEHPAGVGLGGFSYMFPKYRTIPETFIYPETRLTTPHNDYLHVLCETGYAGLALFVGIIILGIAGAVRGLLLKDNNQSEAAFFSFVLLIIFAIYSIADFPFIMPACRFLIFIALGFSASLLIKNSGKGVAISGTFFTVGAAVVFCALMIPGMLWAKNFSSQIHVLKQINSQGKPEQALAEFKRAVSLNPSTKYAYQYAGSTYDRIGDCEKSIGMFKKVLELDPYDYNVVNYLGVSYARCGRNDEAMESFMNATRIYPNYSNPHLNAGILLLQNGKEMNAAEHFRIALELNKNFIEVYIQLAQVEQDAGNYQAAANLLQKALEISPGNQTIMAQMYSIHNEMNVKKKGVDE